MKFPCSTSPEELTSFWRQIAEIHIVYLVAEEILKILEICGTHSLRLVALSIDTDFSDGASGGVDSSRCLDTDHVVAVHACPGSVGLQIGRAGRSKARKPHVELRSIGVGEGIVGKQIAVATLSHGHVG